MCDLSIVLPTCNRGAMLRECLNTIDASVKCAHEIIVVDGASTDETADVISDASKKFGQRLRVIREENREGFVRAANKGFRAASGKYLTWLNDDARPIDHALDVAIAQLENASPNVGFVAMFHRWSSIWNVAYETEHAGETYRLCHVRGTLYANFPVGKRETFERLDYFDERFYVCAADPDLSLKAWYTGLSILPAWGALIDHDEFDDVRRIDDSPRAMEDNRLLFEKWDLPPRNSRRNDFDPTRPCTLKNVRQVLHSAA